MELPDNSPFTLCVFCYKTTDDYLPSFETANYKCFFSLIARHFLNSRKVISDDEQLWWIKNAWKVISEFNSDSSGDGGGGNDKLFTRLIICDICKIITEKWCELYDKVKQLELLMDWEISKLCNVMRCADLDEVTCQKGEKILRECSSSHELPLEDLRKSLKQSFQAYQDQQRKESFPRLSLTPVKFWSNCVVESSCLIKEEDVGSDFFRNHGIYDVQEYNLEEGLGQTGSSNENYMNTAATVTAVKRKGQVFQRKRKTMKVNQDHECPPCGKIFKEAYELRYHQSQKHPELFFPETCSKISVQLTLKRMMDQDFTKMKLGSDDVKMEKGTNGQGSSPFRFKCKLCSRIMVDRTRGKSHLILRHRKNVEEKLKNVSCDQDNEDKPLLKCDHCSQLPAFKDKHKLFQHLITHHLEKYLENGKLDNISDDKFKEYLNYLFKINVMDIWERDSRAKCQFCEVICSGRRHAKSHLILKHFQIVRDQLVGLQREFGEGGPPSISLPVTKTKRKRETRSSKFEGSKDGEGERKKVWKCEGEDGGCGKGFKYRWVMQRHRDKSCKMVGGKGTERREIRKDLNLKGGEEDGVSGGESEQGEVNESVKREEFEIGEEEFVIPSGMEFDHDDDD